MPVWSHRHYSPRWLLTHNQTDDNTYQQQLAALAETENQLRLELETATNQLNTTYQELATVQQQNANAGYGGEYEEDDDDDHGEYEEEEEWSDWLSLSDSAKAYGLQKRTIRKVVTSGKMERRDNPKRYRVARPVNPTWMDDLIQKVEIKWNYQI